MDAEAKTALFNALAWIESKKSNANVDSENVEVGLQCLTEAFGLNLQDANQKSMYEATGGNATFPEIFSAGLTALGLTTKGTAADEDTWENDPAITKNPALWKKWVAKLEDKGFFNGAPVGSDEYNARVKKALAKYKERVADAKPAAPQLTKEEKEKLAEEAKAKGNAALSSGDYETAATLYSTAITHSSDGPNSHIYYANFAAALMYLGRYTEVIDQCEHAIALKPSYVKSYSRMGNAHVQLKQYDDAIDAFRRGLEVDASNAACRDGLAEAERKQQQLQTSSAPARGAGGPGAGAGAGAGGMPDLSGLASMLGGGGGGGGGLADLLSNPAMQQMAASMMQNPAMMQMAQNMMQNPDALSGLMGNLGGGGGAAPGGGGGGGGMPNMAGMADAFRNSPDLMAARGDPDLADFFRDVDQEGPSAAMRHMSNPKVAQLIQNAMARMQG